MSEGATWSWAALFLLGAYHGINPGMGWLFAVALGMQERSRRAVWLALLPITLGHALAIGSVILLAALAGLAMPLRHLKIVVALLLFGLGVFKLIRQRHPRWGGMRVGVADLMIWSFLMASAHGAGLMVVPLVLGSSPIPAAAPLQASRPHGSHLTATADQAQDAEAVKHAHAHAAHLEASQGVAATAVHTLGYLLVTAFAAALVYEKLGVAMLRRAWVNLDLIWAVALLVTSAATLLI
ncbi:MAG: hypothetical protein V3U98_04495 [Acidobacteriota bacterium]